ncbi:MAG: hypothetical protein EBS87_06720 [Sphingomonadaceae bacterium]|jgi:hypothetical protein|nr:hypothetical protein [Sphingomonadaceae bacterium]NBU79867.1 hypothetical protein [Sphingomonadaceae bacterium]NCA01871.1 hypothetical protein [Sphingomonadaceae bacterium]
MHFLAFLFFSSLLAGSALAIRALLLDSSDKIGAALAGDYQLASAQPAPIYLARRRPTRAVQSPASVRRRIAA